MKLTGAFTAMVTPFQGEKVDEMGLLQNIQKQLDAKISGLVFLGTTGEAATLTVEEKEKVIEIGVKEAKDKALIIVGTGSNSTLQTILNTKKAKELGADIALIATPYYNKPTQEGIYRHYEAIAAQAGIPIIVYNVPGRTAVNIETATLLRIAALPNIIGVKEASGNMAQAADVLQIIGNKFPSFSVLSGDDALTLPMMALGARGVISVASNLVPQQIAALVSAASMERFSEARKIHEELLPLFRIAFIETNPIPIKRAMSLCGLAAGECRLPLCEMKSESYEKLTKVLLEMRLYEKIACGNNRCDRDSRAALCPSSERSSIL